MKFIKIENYSIFENSVYVLEAKPEGFADSAHRIQGLRYLHGPDGHPGHARRLPLGAWAKPENHSHFGVKEAVFPFNMFPGVDPVLGPEMRSTGEVMGLSQSYGRAFFKAREATQTALPLEGAVLFTIADRDKAAALEPVRLFRELGFKIFATEGTHSFLKEKGIDTILVRKLGYGRPDLIGGIKNGDINLLVNTPSGRYSSEVSSDIRKAAIKYKVPHITTTAAAIAAAKGIAARRSGTAKVRPFQKYHLDIR